MNDLLDELLANLPGGQYPEELTDQILARLQRERRIEFAGATARWSVSFLSVTAVISALVYSFNRMMLEPTTVFMSGFEALQSQPLGTILLELGDLLARSQQFLAGNMATLGLLGGILAIFALLGLETVLPDEHYERSLAR